MQAAAVAACMLSNSGLSCRGSESLFPDSLPSFISIFLHPEALRPGSATYSPLLAVITLSTSKLARSSLRLSQTISHFATSSDSRNTPPTGPSLEDCTRRITSSPPAFKRSPSYLNSTRTEDLVAVIPCTLLPRRCFMDPLWRAR